MKFLTVSLLALALAGSFCLTGCKTGTEVTTEGPAAVEAPALPAAEDAVKTAAETTGEAAKIAGEAAKTAGEAAKTAGDAAHSAVAGEHKPAGEEAPHGAAPAAEHKTEEAHH
jgi:hypothetical protein